MGTCIVCDEVAGDIELPGGPLIAGRLTMAFHIPFLDDKDVYEGHVLVVPKRHVADFAGLSEPEAAEIGTSVSRASRALKSLGAERVYVATIGHAIDHLHVHLLPRWPETPHDVPWHSVDDWDGARRVSPMRASDLIGRLRAALESESDSPSDSQARYDA